VSGDGDVSIEIIDDDREASHTIRSSAMQLGRKGYSAKILDSPRSIDRSSCVYSYVSNSAARIVLYRSPARSPIKRSKREVVDV
jgi:hypothetical protein